MCIVFINCKKNEKFIKLEYTFKRYLVIVILCHLVLAQQRFRPPEFLSLYPLAQNNIPISQISSQTLSKYIVGV